MTGVQITRRYFSWRARGDSQRAPRRKKKIVYSWWEDLTNVQLVPIKITFFFIMGATQCIMPFTSVFLKALGLTVEEVAIIYAISPLIPILAPFLAGIMNDKLENIKIVLMATVAVSGVVAMFFLTIPPARTEISGPQDVKFDLLCTHHYIVRIKSENNCNFKNSTVKLDKMELYKCGYLCINPPIIMEENIRKKMPNVTIYNVFNNSLAYRCNIGSFYVQKCYVLEAVVAVAAHELVHQRRRFVAPTNMTLKSPEFNLTTNSENNIITAVVHSCGSTNKEHVRCQPASSISSFDFPTMTITSADYRPVSSFKTSWVTCNFHCVGTIPSEKVCHGKMIKKHNVPVTFWLIVIFILMSTFMVGLTYSMFEACVIAILKENGCDYGYQRVYGSVGGIIFAPFTGYLIDVLGSGDYTDYYVCFIIYFILKVVCSLIIVKLDLEFRAPASSVSGNLRKIFSNVETNLLIFIVFISGMCYGFIEQFLPWYLRDLKATNLLIGNMTTIASLAAIPFLAASGRIAKSFGYVQCICFGLICYSIRCIGYSMISNPIWCLPFEVLEGVTTGLLVATAITYGAKLSSRSNVGTMQGILATFHYGLGKGLGTLTGGFMMSRFSARIAFRVFSGAAMVAAFSYYLILKLYILPKKQLQEKLRKEVSAMSVEIVSRSAPASAPDQPKKSFKYSLRLPRTSFRKKAKTQELQIGESCKRNISNINLSDFAENEKNLNQQKEAEESC